MASNLPPGVTESMIPGNRPEDVEFDKLAEDLTLLLTQEGISMEDDHLEKLTQWIWDKCQSYHSAGYDYGYQMGQAPDEDPGAAHEPIISEAELYKTFGAEPQTPDEEWEVEFASRPGERIEIHEFADVCIEAAARDAGLWDGMDSKQFPSFTVYHYGKEVGGG